MDDTRFTTPLYTISSAAFNLAMKADRLRYWCNKDGLLTTLVPETPHGLRLPFIALVEAQLYNEFLKGGLTLKAIREGMQAVRKELGADMMKKDKLAYDGKDILVNLSDNSSFEWIRARDDQKTIPEIVDIGLNLITWDDQDYPLSIKLTAYGDSNVVADYRYAFGKPIIAGTRVRAEDVTMMFKAGETLSKICSEFELDPQTVESIVRAHVATAA